MKNTKIICLIGMMGSGKTSIGKSLSEIMKIKFTDSDLEIEKNQNKSISNIFKENGEEYFRKIEEEIINNIIDQDNKIILSIGGGAFINKNIRNLIKRKTKSIWLDVNSDTIIARLNEDKTRPLLNHKNKIEIINKLIKERSLIYKESDIRISCDNKSIEEITDLIYSEIL